jgi:hypothetical protein
MVVLIANTRSGRPGSTSKSYSNSLRQKDRQEIRQRCTSLCTNRDSMPKYHTTFFLLSLWRRRTFHGLTVVNFTVIVATLSTDSYKTVRIFAVVYAVTLAFMNTAWWLLHDLDRCKKLNTIATYQHPPFVEAPPFVHAFECQMSNEELALRLKDPLVSEDSPYRKLSPSCCLSHSACI